MTPRDSRQCFLASRPSSSTRAACVPRNALGDSLTLERSHRPKTLMKDSRTPALLSLRPRLPTGRPFMRAGYYLTRIVAHNLSHEADTIG